MGPVVELLAAASHDGRILLGRVGYGGPRGRMAAKATDSGPTAVPAAPAAGTGPVAGTQAGAGAPPEQLQAMIASLSPEQKATLRQMLGQ